MITRRMTLTGMAAGVCLAFSNDLSRASPPAPDNATDRAARLSAELTHVEAASRGRLGVAILDTETGLQVDHRGSERFPLCSTFKLLAAAGVLARVDRHEESLSRRVRFDEEDVVTYSPITQHHIGEPGMTLSELCEAALDYSDNTAGNMLLRTLGGPPGLNRYARTLGDDVTHLDRWETALNEATPGDPRDTTTPSAMRANLRRLVLGNALSQSSREQLKRWLLGCRTGDARLKARLPANWRMGDKTGTGGHGSTNDIGLIWRPHLKPIIVAAYLTNTDASPPQRDGTLASVGGLIAEVLS